MSTVPEYRKAPLALILDFGDMLTSHTTDIV